MNIIIAMLCFVLAAASLVYVIFAAKKRGPILSNVFLFASKEQRNSMDTDQLYKECRNIFSFIFFVWVNVGLFVLAGLKLFLYGAYFFLFILVVYAIVISIKSLKDGK